jgi:hypothetical protein
MRTGVRKTTDVSRLSVAVTTTISRAPPTKSATP